MSFFTFIKELQNEIPVTTQLIAIILLVVNIFLPGWGTFAMAFLNGLKWKTIIVAIVQFLTAFILIGWIWAIWWGIICLVKSKA